MGFLKRLKTSTFSEAINNILRNELNIDEAHPRWEDITFFFYSVCTSGIPDRAIRVRKMRGLPKGAEYYILIACTKITLDRLDLLNQSYTNDGLPQIDDKLGEILSSIASLTMNFCETSFGLDQASLTAMIASS